MTHKNENNIQVLAPAFDDLLVIGRSLLDILLPKQSPDLFVRILA
jgi:hypothetical protein